MGENFGRPPKDRYYLDIAEAVSKRGTCLRRIVGAVIVQGDRIISTGFVGAPRGEANCSDLGKCFRKETGVPAGMFYEICRSVHAEENAIINAAATGANIKGAHLYIYSAPRSLDAYPKGQEPTALYLPCYRCKKLILNTSLEEVIVLSGSEIKKLDMDDIRNLVRKDEENWRELVKFFELLKERKNES